LLYLLRYLYRMRKNTTPIDKQNSASRLLKLSCSVRVYPRMRTIVLRELSASGKDMQTVPWATHVGIVNVAKAMTDLIQLSR
jgi:hypothetical protein